MYIFGNPHDKLDKIERDQETFSHTNAAEQRKKMEEDDRRWKNMEEELHL